jgi:hypothetical protein
MSQYRKMRTSQREKIPENFISSWQSSRATSGRPLMRRPPTACAACRAAKVKCDREQVCRRCDSRGINCQYTPPQQQPPATALVTRPNMVQHHNISLPRSSDHSAASNPATFALQEENAAADLAVDLPTDQFDLEYQSYNPFIGWAHGTGQPGVNFLDQSSSRPNQAANSFDSTDEASVRPVIEPLHKPVQVVDFPPMSNLLDAEFFRSLEGVMSQDVPQQPSRLQHTLYNGHEFAVYDGTPASLAVSVRPSASSSGDCQCRGNLLPLVGNVKRAIHQGRLDNVSKVTGHTLKSCQEVIDSPCCNITCADLIFVMALIQQTEEGMRYVMKGDMTDGSVRIAIGEYEVTNISQSKLRHMLVVDLMRQASTLLDSISSVTQNILLSLHPECSLGQLNIDYLKSGVKDFRGVLRSVGDLLGEPSRS